MRFAWGVLVFSLLVIGSAFSQGDYHLNADPARALYRSSVWAHGYIHGYETGYHYGNFDIQVVGTARGEKLLKHCRNPKRHYKSGFGSRSVFDAGFGEGFKAGYADAISGEAFRAASLARTLVSEQHARASVDEGVENGYIEGRTQGLSDARIDAAFAPGKGVCPNSSTPGYCDSYTLGFRWGYNDGYHNQRPDMQARTSIRP